MLARDERGMHAQHGALRAVLGGTALGDRQQLDGVPGVRGGGVVLGRDPRDALHGHLVQRVDGSEGQGGQDGRLRGRVQTPDVGGGVRLRVAQALGLGEGLLEGGALRVHAVEDEVGGAVGDAHDAVHGVPGEGVAQRAEDRDGPGHGRLEAQLRPRAGGGRVELGAVRGQQRLVAGDHGDAGLEGPQDQGAGRFDAAHELHHDVRAVHERLGVPRVQGGVRLPVALRVQGAHGDAAERQGGAHAVVERGGVLGEDPRHLGPHGAAAEQGHGEALGGGGDVLRGGCGELGHGPPWVGAGVVRAAFNLSVRHGAGPRTTGRDRHVERRGGAGGRAAQEGFCGSTSRRSRSSIVSRRMITRACPSRTATTAGRVSAL